MGHAGLDQEVDRRLPELRRSLGGLRAAMEKIVVPGWKWDVAPPWQDDPGSHLRSAQGLLDVLDAKHAEMLKRLEELADEAGPP
jgi:hypothetical protein